MNVDLLVKLLEESEYDAGEIEFLREGFTNGFDIGYEGPQERKSTSENIPLTVGTHVELWNKLTKEVKLGWVAGPYKEILFENFIQSPIGLVPKAGGDQTRLIFHLSYDFKRDNLKSVNHYTPKEKCSVRYRDLDFAVKTYLDLWQQICSSDSETDSSSETETNTIE